MDNFPLQMMLFGLADTFLEPFCYGCAGYLLSYRFTKTVRAKVFAIGIMIFVFLWMDDIWPAIGNKSAKLALASGNADIVAMFADEQQLGQAEFATGESSGVWDIFDLDAWDVIAPAIFVPLAFQAGLVLTRRRWHEVWTQTATPPPPPGYPKGHPN
ncbi:MAG: hypothetical protein DRP66_05220 [Planctomycetota bacterium]|nr:MAG: hypothetical protein DRP66_05220 [Planctomycetota bacterium]